VATIPEAPDCRSSIAPKQHRSYLRNDILGLAIKRGPRSKLA
jgi:hypothetical protein